MDYDLKFTLILIVKRSRIITEDHRMRRCVGARSAANGPPASWSNAWSTWRSFELVLRSLANKVIVTTSRAASFKEISCWITTEIHFNLPSWSCSSHAVPSWSSTFVSTRAPCWSWVVPLVILIIIGGRVATIWCCVSRWHHYFRRSTRRERRCTISWLNSRDWSARS